MTVAIVTGAGSGLGAAISQQLARDGFTVVGADRDGEALTQITAALEAANLAMQGVVADVTDGRDVARLFDQAAGRGRLGVLVNNAGVTTTGASLHEVTDAEWDAAFTACFTPVVRCTRQALLAMLRGGQGGAIVNMASILQRVAAPGVPAYTAAKGAIVALTKQVAVEYGQHGIRCNAVSPGWIRTSATESRLRGPDDEQALRTATPSTRLGMPYDVAAAVSYLASPAAHYVNGSELVIDGASSLVTGIQVLRTTSASNTPEGVTRR